MKNRILILLMIVYSSTADVLENDIKSNIISIETCAENFYLQNKKCEPCSECGRLENMRSKCNNTHNTVCECRAGYYRDSPDGQCKQCTKCTVGWGASPACSSTSNTVCVVCPAGSYSSVESISKSCQSCTLCDERNELILQECTAQQDTTCFKVKRKTDDPLTNSVRCEEGVAGCVVEKDNTYLYTAPLYCAVLGAIILGLLIYVVIRCRINKKRAAQLAASGYLKQPTNYHLIQKIPYSDLTIQSTTTPIVYLQSEGKTVTAVTASTKYKDVPSSVRRTISHSLAQDGSWLKLAHNLGFTPSEVSQIQQKAEYNCKGTSAASILLSEWSKRDFSSIGVINQALATINRLDLVTLINTCNSMQGSEIV